MGKTTELPPEPSSRNQKNYGTGGTDKYPRDITHPCKQAQREERKVERKGIKNSKTSREVQTIILEKAGKAGRNQDPGGNRFPWFCIKEKRRFGREKPKGLPDQGKGGKAMKKKKKDQQVKQNPSPYRKKGKTSKNPPKQDHQDGQKEGPSTRK